MHFLGCVEGDIRLLDGTTSAEGHVEICKNNVWGSICRSGWDNIDARVVCRQLGFSVAGKGVYMHTSNINFFLSGAVSTLGINTGYDRRPILLDNVRCLGHEERLGDCPASNVLATYCSHSTDARVRCMPKTGKSTNVALWLAKTEL